MRKTEIKIIFVLICAVLLMIASYSEGAKKATITLIPKTAAVESGKTKKFVVKKTGGISKNVKWYVKIDESLGSGDGITTGFTLGNQNIQENSEVISVGGVKQIQNTDYTIDYVLGTVNFIITAPPNGIEITASYFAEGGSTNVGIIDGTGIYTAPDKAVLTSNPMRVVIKAVSVDNPEISKKAFVKVYTPPVILSLKISPNETSIAVSDKFIKEKMDFTLKAVKKGKKNVTVEWYINDVEGGNSTVGTIVGTGLIKGTYTAPLKVLAKPVTIKVVSSLNENIFAKATVTVNDQLIANGIPTSVYFGEVIIGKDITNPIQEIFTITTRTEEAVGWQATSVPQWLEIIPRSGTTPDQVVMQVTDTGRLNDGLHTGTLIFQSTKKGVNPLTFSVLINARSEF